MTRILILISFFIFLNVVRLAAMDLDPTNATDGLESKRTAKQLPLPPLPPKPPFPLPPPPNPPDPPPPPPDPDPAQTDSAATITKNPKGQQISLGEDAIFEVRAKGKKPLTFQWFHNGLEIEGENTNILKIKNASVDDAGRYSCKVANKSGSDFSSEAILSVSGKLMITEQPEDAVSFTGPNHKVKFSVYVTGKLPIDYQWQHNGKDLVGENFFELEIDSVSPNNAGFYRCHLSNDSGETYTNDVKLEVRRTVKITKQPQKKVNKKPGETARFSISVSGYGKIFYQWQKIVEDMWSDIEGETKSLLEINSLGPLHSGQYRCKAKNGGGEVTSDSSDLTIEGALAIKNNLKDQYIGWTENEHTFRVHISGSVPYDIRWFKNGRSVPIHIKKNHSSSLAELTITNLKKSHEGEYYCIIDNSFHKPCTSKTTNLLIKRSVRITQHPGDVEAKQGDTVRLSIKVEGDGDVAYQWLKDGIARSEYRSKNLIIEKVSSSQSGQYKCIATNEGRSDTSRAAILDVEGTIVITQPSKGDQWEIGTLKKIKWKGEEESVKRVNIYFSKNGGKKYYLIYENVDNRKGEIHWRVENIISSYCKIRIANSENDLIDDETDGFFRIDTYDVPIINFRNRSILFSKDQFQIIPNPVKSGIDQSVFFVLISPIKILEREISIYDALGNKIAFMPGTQLIQEKNRCNLGTWNLLNRSGEKITNGTYLAVLTITDTSGNKHILPKLIGINDR